MSDYEKQRDDSADRMAHGLVKAWLDEGRDEMPALHLKLYSAWKSGWWAANGGIPCTTDDFPKESAELKPFVDDAFKAGYGYRQEHPPA